MQHEKKTEGNEPKEVTGRRKEIWDSIAGKQDQIKQLENEIKELQKEYLLLSDDIQWFTEKTETVKVRDGRKLVKVEKLIGRVHWKEAFVDGDNADNVLVIERSAVVRVNGEWV